MSPDGVGPTRALVVRAQWAYYLSNAQFEFRRTTLPAKRQARPASDAAQTESVDVGVWRKKPSRSHSKIQNWMMRKHMYQLPFTKCGNCGELSVYKSYANPTYHVDKKTGERGALLIDWDRWCYTCGARDEQVSGEGETCLLGRTRLSLRELEALLAKMGVKL